jgi:predicted extracellular nuclease
VEGNDIGGIDVGFLTKSTVSVVSTTQLGSALTFTNPCNGAAELLNDRPTFRLRGTSNGMAFTVFVNHLRSLNGIDDLAPCSASGFSSTAGGRVRAKRAAQANYVAGLVQDELTANPAAKILLVGDFNAFEVNDGFVDIVNTIMGTPPASTQVVTSTLDPTYANMTNLLSLLPTPQRYSYVFDGNHQTLDHAILNPAAMSQYVGGGFVRVNADFNEANFRGNFSTPERYSDHDPVYVRLSTGTNVTPQVTVTRGVIGFNRATRLYQMPVILTNTSASTITGPMLMAITNMTEAATLTNAASFTPGGAVYTDLPSSLAPGESATVVLTFSLPSSMPVNFTVSLFRN